MSKKIRLGYDILSKRAIETESGVNIDEALKNIVSFKKVPGTGADGHPDVDRPDTRYMYIVKVDGAGQPDSYKEWIWTQPADAPGYWECVGDTADENSSWKRWSEFKGSTGRDESVYIGQNNTSTSDSETYNFGHDNEISGEPTAGVENALAMNLGSQNSIDGEGVNIGKDNTSDNFGITMGQKNAAHNAAIVLGENNEADKSSIALGKRAIEVPIHSKYPAIRINGKYYPVVKSTLPYNTWVSTEKAAFDKNGTLINVWTTENGKTGHVAHINMRTRKAFFVQLVGFNGPIDNGEYVYGYTDDNGDFVETTTAPDQEHPIERYYRIVHNGVTFVGTTTYNRDPMDDHKTEDSYAYTEFFLVTDSSIQLDVEYDIDYLIDKGYWFPAVYRCGTHLGRTDFDINSNIWINTSLNRAVRYVGRWNQAEMYAPLEKILVMGFDKDGVFYPYNGHNADGNTVYEKYIDSSEFVLHDFTKEEYEELGFSSFDELITWVPADNNSIAVGDAQKVYDKSVGVSAVSARIPSWPDVGAHTNTYTNLLTTGESEEYQLTFPDDHDDIDQWPSEDDPILIDEVASGSIGLLVEEARTDITSAGSITGGSVGIGHRNTASGASIVVGSNSRAQEHSYTFGGDGMNASGNSVAVGRGGITASNGSITLGMNGNNASASSISIGMAGSRADNGSIIVGTNGSSANNGSINVGTNGSSATGGAFAFGASNQATDGGVAIGSNGNALVGGCTFGRNARAENGGINIATSGESLYRNRTASGTIIKYRNPDGVYVPIQGNISIKSGYTIGKVRRLDTTYTYEGNPYWVVIGEYNTNGYFTSYSKPRLYDSNGNYYREVDRDESMARLYSGPTIEYWQIRYGSTYTFIRANTDNPSTETDNLSALKAYFQVSCKTFTQNSQVYVYADGFNYPDTSLSYRYVDVNDCTFGVSDYWTGKMIGYTDDAWRFATDGGAYAQGVAIGRQAHAEGSSIAVAPNYADSFEGNVEIENYINSQANSLPYYIGIRISKNRTHANGNSVALGNEVLASDDSMAVGKSSVKAYGKSLSIGRYTNTADENSFAIGQNSNSATDYSFAIGQNSNYAFGNSFAIGDSGNKAMNSSMAIGYSNNANDMSFVFGKNNAAESGSISFGNASSAYYGSFAIGDGARALDNSFTSGHNSIAFAHSLAIGENLEAYTEAVIIGRGGSASNYALSMGWSNVAAHASVAIGRSNYAGGYPNTTLNTNAEAIAMGTNNQAANYGIAFGRNNWAYASTLMVGDNNAVSFSGSPDGTLVGHSNLMETNGYNIALGKSNSTGKESIAIGSRNSVYGWSIAMGTQNVSSGSPGSHTTMIGYHNLASSDLQTIEKKYRKYVPSGDTGSSGGHWEEVTDTIICDSIILGTGNTSMHYNSILIGANNVSANALSETKNTSDDGFMLAIGYGNSVGRNYDIAVGYHSIANGGENLAIQHSTAEGYRNWSMIDSTISPSILNIAISESKLVVPEGNLDYTTGLKINCSSIKNILFNSDLLSGSSKTSMNTISSAKVNVQSGTETFIQNDVKNTQLNVQGGMFERNFIRTNGKSNSILQINTKGFIDNIIYGERSGLGANAKPASEIRLNSYNSEGGKATRNIFVNSHIECSAIRNYTTPMFGSMHGNKFVASTIYLHGNYYNPYDIERPSTLALYENNVDHSFIDIEFDYTSKSSLDHHDFKLTNNTVLGRSKIDYRGTFIDTDDNFLFRSYLTVQSGLPTTAAFQNTSNFLFGTVASNVCSCVSFGDRDDNSPSGGLDYGNIQTPNMFGALRSFNFGDNTTTTSEMAVSFGVKNTITNTSRTLVIGQGNSIASSSWNVCAGNNLIGDSNSIGGYSIYNNTVFGTRNTIYGGTIVDNYVFGEANHIGTSNSSVNTMHHNFVFGRQNTLQSELICFNVFGSDNLVMGLFDANDKASNGFIQGNNHVVNRGSNVVTFGNGNVVSGHNSVAIGCQVNSSQWQTVIGKYNRYIPGPTRGDAGTAAVNEGKALFIIGNGYGPDTDNWQNEQYITRSNAMVVYANGNATFSGAVEAANIPPAPVSDGRYALNCTVTSGVPTYSWVPLGTATV